MGKRLKLIVSSGIFIVILLLCIQKVTDVVQRKSSDFKYTPFFEQEEDFDVLFMGTSHVINGIFPMELWNDYGIVSYNFGGHSNQVATSYWVMENALDYTSPKLMVIDVLSVGSNRKVSNNSDYIHLSFDCFPLSLTKIRGIYDLCDGTDDVDKNGICYYDVRGEFLWDLGKYHTRWTELTENEITNESVSKEKGAESRIAVATPDEYTLVDKTRVLDNTDTVGMTYLKKMIEDCQSRGIEVLLVYLPYPADEDAQIAANSVYAVAEEYGVNYINFVAMDNVVDYDTDCYDEHSHLNPSGARKVTDYLGQYITEHYDIPDRRNDAAYQSWYDDYDTYIDYKIANLNGQNKIENELMLLADDGFSSCIYIKADSPLLQMESVQKLLQNMAGDTELTGLAEAARSGQSYFLLVDNGKKEVMESVGETLSAQHTTFGEVYFTMEDEIPYLYIQDMETNRLDGDWYLAESEETEPDMQIFSINRYTGEIVSETKWEYSSKEEVVKR